MTITRINPQEWIAPISVLADVQHGVVPSSSTWPFGVNLKDKNGNTIAYLRTPFQADGGEGVQLETRRVINGSGVNNGIQMYIDASGKQTVSVSSPAAWRSALGITEASGTASQLGLTITPKSGYSVSNVSGRRYGRVVVAYMDVYHTSALNTGAGFSPMSTNLQPAIVSSDNAVGYVVASQNMWLKTLGALASNSTFGIVVVGILP